jgi:carboxyl-terminal processing protease
VQILLSLSPVDKMPRLNRRQKKGLEYMKNRKYLSWGLGLTVLGIALVVIIRVTELFAFAENQYTKIKIFMEIYKDIQTQYVDETDPIDLLDKAIEGMLEELDPHTQYMDAKNSGRMDDSFQGYEGIGISFVIIDGKITIMDVMDDGPSRRIGLERGDRIVKINGKSAIDIEMDEVPKLLKGPRNTKVSVHVERPNWDEPKEMVITRDKTYEQSVPHYYVLDNGVGYVHIERFSATTEREFEMALRALEQEGISKLILDLRNDTGGYLQAAVGVADRFLPGNRNIVYTRGRTQTSDQQFNSSDNHTHPFYPMIVLINDNSASASEIVSGALQDWDRALIVGTTSFGKGLVQTPIRFADGSQLLLTTARYFTPSGRLIQRPYEGKSREDYYSQANHGDNQDVSIYPDSLIFRTQAGRAVYGGGGITPDFMVKGDTLNTELLEVYKKVLKNRSPFLDVCDQYKEDHPELQERQEWYVENFEITPEFYEQWVRYLQEKESEDTEEDDRLTMQDMQAHKDFFEHQLKAEIAHQFWGDAGQKEVRLTKDNQLDSAIAYFNDAEELLKNYSSYMTKK